MFWLSRRSIGPWSRCARVTRLHLCLCQARLRGEPKSPHSPRRRPSRNLDRGGGDSEAARSRPAARSRFRPTGRPCPNVRSCSGARARTGALSLGAAGHAASSGARSTGAGEFAAAASGGPASGSTARDHAPADHPRQRFAESRGASPHYGNSSGARPGQSPWPVSCRAYAAAPPGESGAGSRRLESGVNRTDG
jgi:hypothetical protein